MDEVLKFLQDNPVFYLATVEGTLPKVRPFGFAMVYQGKLCFCTSNQKDVYKQMKANPNIEISTASPKGEWLRLSGKAVFITSRDAKKAALDTMPSLRKMYSEDDTIYEIFAIEQGEASFYSFGASPRSIKF